MNIYHTRGIAAMTSNIYEQTLIHWAKVIEPFFPENTRFVTVDTKQRFCIYVQSPPENPEEESRIPNRATMLAFTDEAINEYIFNYEPGSHRKADIMLKKFVATKLRDRMPGRNTLQENQVPEYWLVTTDILNR
jgi:hypothetical protein